MPDADDQVSEDKQEQDGAAAPAEDNQEEDGAVELLEDKQELDDAVAPAEDEQEQVGAVTPAEDKQEPDGAVTPNKGVESSAPSIPSSASHLSSPKATGALPVDSRPTSHPTSQEPPPSRRGRKGVTVQWPFLTQSIATDALSLLSSPTPALFRRATWNPPKLAPDDAASVTQRDSTLIPDYVVNFIRGETPESIARRKQNGGSRGMRAVKVMHHKPQRSHMGYMERMDEADGDAHSHMTSTSTATELQQMLPGKGKGKGGNALRRLTTGWRSGIVLNVVLGLVIWIAGLVSFVVAGTTGAFVLGDMTLFTGSCATTSNLNWALHAVINVAVLVLLVGANYVFQVLSSPTRSEITKAHESKKWLEIGVPSVRNFLHIGKGRGILSMALLVAALATQIIYNSLVFVSESGLEYSLIGVKSSFLTGGQFSNTTVNNDANITQSEFINLRNLATANELTNLSIPACIDVFSAAFNNEFQNVLLIVNEAADSGNSLIITVRGGLNASAASNLSTRTTTTNTKILIDGAEVSTCLAQPTDPLRKTCTVSFNSTLFIVVLGLNLVILLLTAFTLLFGRYQPLVTLGDAIASFLKDPDPATRKNALLTKTNIRSKMGDWGFTEGKYWAPTRGTQWFRTASLTQWSLFAIFLFLTLAMAGAGLAFALTVQVLATPTLSPFGRVNPRATFLVFDSLAPFVVSVLTALPQLLLGGFYLATNTLLTAFFLSRESAQYAILASGFKPRGLRVSAAPIGAQTTSIFLTLPRPVSWALAVWFAGMGFVLSQGVFAVLLVADQPRPSKHIMGIGLSGVALAVLLAMVGLLGLAIAGVALGLQMPNSVMTDGRAVGNPLVFEGGSCSAVLSARAHRVPGETDVWWCKIAWGAVADETNGSRPPGDGEAEEEAEAGAEAESGVKHATYTAGGVAMLDGLERYV